MTVRWTIALGAVALVALALAATAGIDAGLGPQALGWGEIGGWGVAALVIAAVGALIVVRAEVRVIGWLLLGLAVATALIPLTDAFALDRFGRPGDPGFLARLVAAPPSYVPVFACLAMIALHFPDGRLPGARWRAARAMSLAGYAALFIGATLSPDPAGPVGPAVEPPFPDTPAWVWGPLGYGGIFLTLASLAIAAAAVVVRHRRARGIERLQLRWLAFAAALTPAAMAICGISVVALGEAHGTVIGGLLVTAVLALTGAVAIAITRHGLYEIDRVVNRTLVYTALTAIVAAVWFVVALAAGLALGRGSSLPGVMGAAVAALLMRPLRDRVQTAVDRRFSRDRHRAREAIRRFEQDVRDGRAEPERIGAVLVDVLGDPTAELLFRPHASDAHVDGDGRPAGVVPGPDRAATPVLLKGSRIGVLLHDPALLERPDLLHRVLRDAALSVELARLRLELRVQLEEVERSRERIVRAGYEERRRIERDLHDGAQRRLVAIGMVLRRAERSASGDARDLAPVLGQAVDEIGRAVAELRALASGVHPAMLDEGLPAALEELARSSAVPVQLDLDDGRLPAAVEAAAYFVTSEAITNAIKHAAPSRVRVRARRRNGSLRLVVDDDGAGGACIGPGGGLQGLVDRVEAHGGRLRLHSPHGAGTRLEVELPCGS